MTKRMAALERRIMVLETLVADMLEARAHEAGLTPGGDGEFHKLQQAEQRYRRDFKAVMAIRGRGADDEA